MAMVALRLGAAEALGVDVDPVAIDCARDYAQVNGFDQRLTLSVGNAKGSSGMTRSRLHWSSRIWIDRPCWMPARPFAAMPPAARACSCPVCWSNNGRRSKLPMGLTEFM